MKSTLLILAFLSILSCATSHTSSKNHTKPNSIQFPKEFRASHRIILTIKNYEYELIGYLLFRAPNTYYAAAYTEAGKAIFKFKMINGSFHLINKPKLLSDNAIREGIGFDIQTLFSGSASENKNISSISYQIDETGLSSHPKNINYHNKIFNYQLQIELLEISRHLPENFDRVLKEL